MAISHDALNTMLASLALATSVASASFSYVQLQESRRAAAEAVDVAKRANDIAIGNVFPAVTVRIDTKNVQLSIDGPDPPTLWVHNHGEIQIAGVLVRVIPLDGLVYEKANPVKLPRDLRPISLKFDFSESVAMNGSVRIDLAPLLAAAIHENLQRFGQQGATYRGSFNIVVGPIKRGEAIASTARPMSKQDRDIVSIDFTPSAFANLDVKRSLEALSRSAHIIQ